MDTNTLNASLLATVSKHHIAGIVAIVIGVALVGAGGLRVLRRTVGAVIVPLAGLVVVVLGILVFAHVI